MNTYINPPRERWAELCRRAEQNNDLIRERVEEILSRVECERDAALYALAEQIDGVKLSSLRVSSEEFAEAERKISEDLKQAIEQAISNIETFHRAQLPAEVVVETMPQVRCVQRAVPIQRVGLYIPGGTAPLFSTVLMLAVPARVAGCRRVVLCTPTNKQGKVAAEVLYAASRAGVEEVYKVGGAQAVAAMAFGTESVPKVDKIFGPGNRYVTLAKQQVATRSTAIDMPAGPSEVMVMADGSAEPSFVAADMLSQAEHGLDSQAMLVCCSAEFALKVEAELERQMAQLSRKEYLAESLLNSRIVVFESKEKMIEFANEYAAEHLIISMEEAWAVADQIVAAGSVFVGNYSPESAGDYASGTNHTLPTSAWARSYGGVNVDSFMRKMTLQQLTQESLARLSPTIITMAQAEGIEAHAAAVSIRIHP